MWNVPVRPYFHSELRRVRWWSAVPPLRARHTAYKWIFFVNRAFCSPTPLLWWCCVVWCRAVRWLQIETCDKNDELKIRMNCCRCLFAVRFVVFLLLTSSLLILIRVLKMIDSSTNAFVSSVWSKLLVRRRFLHRQFTGKSKGSIVKTTLNEPIYWTSKKLCALHEQVESCFFIHHFRIRILWSFEGMAFSSCCLYFWYRSPLSLFFPGQVSAVYVLNYLLFVLKRFRKWK